MYRLLQGFLATVLILTAGAGLLAQEFPRAKMYIEQDHKLKLVAVSLHVQEESLRATTLGKNPQTVQIPYSKVTGMEYERSKHRRWKMGVLVSGLALMSKGKKHWLAVIQGDDETVFQLSKTNYQKILSAVESHSGLDVKMIASRG